MFFVKPQLKNLYKNFKKGKVICAFMYITNKPNAKRTYTVSKSVQKKDNKRRLYFERRRERKVFLNTHTQTHTLNFKMYACGSR